MVGGYATNLHGFQRYTGDIDIWIEETPENRRRLRAAFLECGMGDYYMMDKIQFVPGWTDFRLKNGLRRRLVFLFCRPLCAFKHLLLSKQLKVTRNRYRKADFVKV